MKFSGFGGPGMTIGQLMKDQAPQYGCEVRTADNGWTYTQITGDRYNGTHITSRATGLADHASTYANTYRVGRKFFHK